MKTENEKFVLARLRARKEFFVELADEARRKAEEAATAYATCAVDDTKGAEELEALFQKMNNLAKLQGDAEVLAFNAERVLYYAERGDEGNASFFKSVVNDYDSANLGSISQQMHSPCVRKSQRLPVEVSVSRKDGLPCS
jgi:hypothetical protein